MKNTSINRLEQERKNYLRDLHLLRIKYSIIFNDIAKESAREQVTTANR